MAITLINTSNIQNVPKAGAGFLVCEANGERVDVRAPLPADGVWQAFDELLPDLGLFKS